MSYKHFEPAEDPLGFDKLPLDQRLAAGEFTAEDHQLQPAVGAGVRADMRGPAGGRCGHAITILVVYQGSQAVELATLERVSSFNHDRLLGPIGHLSPAAAARNYYQQLERSAVTA